MAEDGSARTDLRRGAVREAAVVAALTVALAVSSVVWDLPGAVATWSAAGWPVGHVVLVLGVSHLFMIVFGARRGAQLKREHEARGLAEAEAAHRAQHDHLTGLPSRAVFFAAVDDALADVGDGPPPAVVLLDLDRFGEVNATLGHRTGNSVLRVVAGRLSSALPAGTVLARLGGDESGCCSPAWTPSAPRWSPRGCARSSGNRSGWATWTSTWRPRSGSPRAPPGTRRS